MENFPEMLTHAQCVPGSLSPSERVPACVRGYGSRVNLNDILMRFILFVVVVVVFVFLCFFAYLPTLSEPPICPRNMKLIWSVALVVY